MPVFGFLAVGPGSISQRGSVSLAAVYNVPIQVTSEDPFIVAGMLRMHL